MHRHQKNRQGFTLVELLVVISIIGVLSGILFVNFSGVRERGRDTSRKNDMRQTKTALRLYYNDYQTYPDNTNPGFQIIGCDGPSGPATCSWGNTWTRNNSQYMVLNTDPLNTGYNVYRYLKLTGGEGFQLCTVLENASDTQAADSRRLCGVSDISQAPCGITTSSIFNNIYMMCN